MITFLIQNQSEGVFNAVSHSITYKDLYKSYFAMHRKRFLSLSIPSRLLKLILGQFVEIFSSSQRIEKSRIVDLGFKFSIDSFEKFLALPKK
jgi:NAD dependent epimerase/dehydratase family enzyme